MLTFLTRTTAHPVPYFSTEWARAATSIVVKHPEFINDHTLLEKALAEATVIKDRDDREDALFSPSILHHCGTAAQL